MFFCIVQRKTLFKKYIYCKQYIRSTWHFVIDMYYSIGCVISWYICICKYVSKNKITSNNNNNRKSLFWIKRRFCLWCVDDSKRSDDRLQTLLRWTCNVLSECLCRSRWNFRNLFRNRYFADLILFFNEPNKTVWKTKLINNWTCCGYYVGAATYRNLTCCKIYAMLMLIFGCVVGLAAILTAIDASLVDTAIGQIKNDAECVERANSMLTATRWSAVFDAAHW